MPRSRLRLPHRSDTPPVRVFAVGMVKDEADIIGSTVLNLLGWGVERVIVADNGSTDATRSILDTVASATQRVDIVDDPEVGYYQARKMTALLRQAEAAGAEWVIPFDADELWIPADWRNRTIADELADLPGWMKWAAVPIWNHYCTTADPEIGDPVRRIQWRHVKRNPLDKVVVRAGVDLALDMGNHRVLFPDEWEPGGTALQIRHFPYRSAEQFVRKARNGAAAYAATEGLDDFGGHWRGYGAMIDEWGADAGDAWFREHFLYDDLTEMVWDPAPLPAGLWLA